MPKEKKKNPLDFTVSINSTCHNTWMSETNKSPQVNCFWWNFAR